MSYSLEFVESALKEWRKLAPAIREQMKSKLRERLENPHVPAARLHGLPLLQNQVAYGGLPAGLSGQ